VNPEEKPKDIFAYLCFSIQAAGEHPDKDF
jgi:hypothetical protein